MKYTWEAKDITAGRFVCKSKAAGGDVLNGWSAKWTDKIGFVPENGANQYCLISMTDGLVCGKYTKAELAKWLNENEMMPMPHEWLIKTIEFMRDHYETY